MLYIRSHHRKLQYEIIVKCMTEIFVNVLYFFAVFINLYIYVRVCNIITNRCKSHKKLIKFYSLASEEFVEFPNCSISQFHDSQF